MGMKEKEEFTYKQFIELFIHPDIGLMSNTPVPRISDEIVKVLQLVHQSTTGDWYLYQNYIEIRVYGCELPPYKLPKYLPIRILDAKFISAQRKKDHKAQSSSLYWACAISKPRPLFSLCSEKKDHKSGSSAIFHVLLYAISKPRPMFSFPRKVVEYSISGTG